MRKIYLSIGSNKGNRYSFIKEALRLIRKDIGKVILMSKIYETKSWGFQSDDFLNICIMIKSELLPSELLNKLSKSRKAVDTGKSGTFGYRIKEGVNSGKVIKHLKKTSDNI